MEVTASKDTLETAIFSLWHVETKQFAATMSAIRMGYAGSIASIGWEVKKSSASKNKVQDSKGTFMISHQAVGPLDFLPTQQTIYVTKSYKLKQLS